MRCDARSSALGRPGFSLPIQRSFLQIDARTTARGFYGQAEKSKWKAKNPVCHRGKMRPTFRFRSLHCVMTVTAINSCQPEDEKDAVATLKR